MAPGTLGDVKGLIPAAKFENSWACCAASDGVAALFGSEISELSLAFTDDNELEFGVAELPDEGVIRPNGGVFPGLKAGNLESLLKFPNPFLCVELK